ncbi:MAG TPA: SMC family ATPase, partial [Clostridia bacterium]|nr:SMC family ATPase [Clostridia bacterium]
MKPLSLTMSALGPYARETRISFEDVSQGLFLITGETGSGKTMVFDAIMFALYDDSSGSSRGSGSLRSDFARPDQETFVELEFLLRSQRYRIRRSPRYQRPRLRGQGMTEQAATVELSLPDGRVMTSKREVDAHLVDLIGLDKDQFRQVAMIAQGAFFDLIEATSLERSRIYRRLFNTWIYQDLENRLLAAYSAARANLTTSSSQLFMDLKRFSFPDWAQELSQEAQDLVAAKDIWALDPFLEKLEGLADDFQDKKKAIDQRREAAGARLAESQARLDKIRQANQCLDQLEKAKEAAAQLEAKSQAHEADLAKLDAADRAARLVTAPYREWQQAKKSLAVLEEDLKAETLRLDQAQAGYQAALDQSRQVSDQADQLQALPGRMSSLEKEMADLDKVMKLDDKMAGMDRSLQNKEEALTELETKRQGLEAELQEAEARLESLAQVDS